MLKRFFSGKGQRAQQAAAASVVLDVQEQGLCYALSLANVGSLAVGRIPGSAV